MLSWYFSTRNKTISLLDCHSNISDDRPQKSPKRQKGEIENQALFSFKDIPQNGTFMDFMNWHIVLNSQNTNYAITNRETSMIFRPSWTKADWLRYGRRNPGSVQLVVPELDLRKADSIWVRNRATKKGLKKWVLEMSNPGD